MMHNALTQIGQEHTKPLVHGSAPVLRRQLRLNALLSELLGDFATGPEHATISCRRRKKECNDKRMKALKLQEPCWLKLSVLLGELLGEFATGPERASASCRRREMRRRGSGENTSSAPFMVPATMHSSGVTLSAVTGPLPPSYLITSCRGT